MVEKLAAVLFGVVFIGFGQGLQALYLSDDLEKLWVTPIRSEAIMTAKLLSRVPSTILILFLGTIPALIAFGVGLGFSLPYYILGILLILITPLFGISLGALIAIFLVRLLPARRLNEWVGAASIIIGVLLSLLLAVPGFLGGNTQQANSDLLATLFTSVILAGFVAVMMLRPQEDGSSLFSLTEGEEIDILSAGVMVSGLIYFLGWLAFYNLALTTLSIERKAFYILKTAPLSASQLFRAKTFGIFIPYAALATIFLVIMMVVMKLSLIWTPFGWMTLMIIGYGLFSFLVSLGFQYPNLDWEDPRRMQNRKAILPALLGTLGYSIIAQFVAITTYFYAQSEPALAIPIVIMGLALLAGGTWFFLQRSTNRVEKAWPRIGVNS